MTYAFKFDASSCSGCKACQAACKDKNNLPAGVLWRRVIEVSGGEWSQNGGAWENSVFAYNLSLACNHCVHPKCAGVCPTNAYHVRENGIVLLDSSRCVGCGYCAWACPYAVPQYNPRAGRMSKCNFCFDYLDAGQAPACVSACPLRVLDFMEVGDQPAEETGLSLWAVPGSQHPFPLPEFSRTQPHLHINPHPAMQNNLKKRVANREEFKPGPAKSELPLVFFTLLAQTAVGLFWSSLWLFDARFDLLSPQIEVLRRVPFALAGLFLVLGMLVSFAHLGTKTNAWRVLANLRKSSLSKEIVYLGLFLVSGFLFVLSPGGFTAGLASLVGFGLIFTMSGIYWLRSMAAWNSWRTPAAFFLSALTLGFSIQTALLQIFRYLTGIWLPFGWLDWLVFLSLGLELGLMLSNPAGLSARPARARLGLILLAGAVLLGRLFMPQSLQLPLSLIVLLSLLLEEGLGRWLFYAELEKRRL